VEGAEYHEASVAITRPSSPSESSARRKPRSSSTPARRRDQHGDGAVGTPPGGRALHGGVTSPVALVEPEPGNSGRVAWPP
jgi:hypothetical protein